MATEKKTAVKKTVKKATVKKVVAPKAAVKKVAAKAVPKAVKVEAPKATVKAAAPSAKAKTLSREEIFKQIEFEAYILAEKDGFVADPLTYWTAAEAKVHGSQR